MTVERWTGKVKIGYTGELIEVLKAASEEVGLTNRICSFMYCPFDVVILDNEFESEEAVLENQAVRHDKGGPALAEWGKKRPELVVSETHELLRVH